MVHTSVNKKCVLRKEFWGIHTDAHSSYLWPGGKLREKRSFFTTTAGPRITSFCPVLFHENVGKKKKN